MRKQYWTWSLAVFGIIGTAYGLYSVISSYSKGKGLSVWGLLLLILGALALIAFIVYAASVYAFNKKKAKNQVPPAVEKEEEPEPVPEPEPEPEPKEEPAPVPEEEPEAEEEMVEEPEEEDEEDKVIYESAPQRSYSYSAPTIYVKKVGYGPMLRIEGNRIVDMRTNTYYRIEDNAVTQDGYGIRYEIRGNQIRDAFGGYLYELSGSNINKVFGGFYASVSGSYITLYDNSQKFETTDSLSKKQILVAAVLLFGNY